MFFSFRDRFNSRNTIYYYYYYVYYLIYVYFQDSRVDERFATDNDDALLQYIVC